MRVERTIWAVIGTAPLSALAVCAVLAFTLRPQPPRTGDALLDAFLEAVLQENPLLDSEDYTSCVDQYTSPDLTLPEAAFEALEQEFGADPRFWMLRYRFARLSEIDDDSWDEMGYSRKQLSILEEARGLGSIDAAGLHQLLSRKRSSWFREAGDDCQAEGFSYKTDPESYLAAQRSKVDEKHGSEERALFVELRAAAPGSAMPHYWLAQDFADRGDYAAAIEELERGNAAPVLSGHIGFPFDLIQKLADQPHAGLDSTLSGALLMNISEFGYPNHIHLKKACKKLAGEAARRRDAGALTTVHHCISRYARLDEYGMLAPLVACAMLKDFEKDLSALWPGGLSAGQRQALSALHSPRGRILAEAQKINRLHPGYGLGQAALRQPWQARLEAALGGTRSTTVRVCREFADFYAQEQKALTGPVARAVDELTNFEFDPRVWR